MARTPPRRANVCTLTDLAQVRVLADPLRMRILERLCEEERTTKQVAELLGEKPTKLYHHVEALERVGLIRLARTRQNRGTLEKYYLAVARTFRADSRLFSERAGAGGGALGAMISTIVEGTSIELKRLAASGPGPDCIADEGVLGYLEVSASASEIDGLRRRIQQVIDELPSRTKGRKKAAGRRYRLTVAFYPLDRFEERSKSS